MTLSLVDILRNIVIWGPGILFAITLHEWAHGFVASRFGDRTPAQMGRLTLNPLPHIDPVWSLLVPGVLLVASLLSTGHPLIFGGAKPVPINPRNFRGSKRVAMFWVALAGPGMNLLLALMCAVLIHPVLTLPKFFAAPIAHMLVAAIQVNSVLAVFNLLPLPPLDGGRILTALLPPNWGDHLAALERFGLPIMLLLLFSGLLSQILWPLMEILLGFYLGLAGLV